MKFLLDHDVPEDLCYLLEQLGHDVTLLRKALPVNASDEAVLQFAYTHNCVLLTCNREDFLDLAAKKPRQGICDRYPASNASLGTGSVVSTFGELARQDSKTT